jgi:hypothetical protein
MCPSALRPGEDRLEEVCKEALDVGDESVGLWVHEFESESTDKPNHRRAAVQSLCVGRETDAVLVFVHAVYHARGGCPR